MSLTPPGPPLYPSPPSGDPAEPAGAPKRSGGRTLLIGSIVFALLAAGFAGWQLLDRTDGLRSVLPGLPSATTPTPTGPMPATDPKLARFYHQKVAWNACQRDFCARVRVPLDYAKPLGPSVRLAVLKVPAQKPSERIGALVVNPGGPGGSGVDFAAAGSPQFGDNVSDHYDIVGFDPRGVGVSDPLKCVDTKALDGVIAFDPDPDTAAERDRMDTLVARFGLACLLQSGQLTRHMSTKEVAKDMDILRAVLAEPKLNYLGASYGTFLGATYAEMFPHNVGRFVLDGAIDPSLTNMQLALQQGKGFETALRAYLQDCIDQGSCFLGSTVDQGVERIRQFLYATDASPLNTGSDRKLTEGLAMVGIWLPLYVKSYWPKLTDALKQALQDNKGSALLALADAYSSRGPDGYTDNSMSVLYAVNCLDHDDYVPTKDIPKLFKAFDAASPTFGRAFAFGLATCASWPIKSGRHSTAIHAEGAPPIVVIGTTRDPATPYSWAQALAAQLDSGTLITRDGDGHTGFRQGNSCVDDAVEAWLVDGKQPKADLHC